VPEKKNTNWIGFLIWGICIFFYLYEFFLRTVIGTFQIPLMNELEISSLKFAFLSSTSYMLIYGAMQIPVSLIVDRFGLKKSLSLGAIACTLGSFGLAFSHHYSSAIGFRILMGFGSSFGFICLLISIYDWLPRQYNGLFIGTSQFLGTMGPLMAAGPLRALTDSAGLGWRRVFLIMGTVGTFLIGLVWLFVKNNIEQKGAYTILRRSADPLANIKRIFNSWQPWLIASYCACVYFTIEFLSENEGISFIMQKGFSPKFSSSMISLTWLGFAIGCPSLGLLSDLIQRRKSILILSGMTCFLAISAIVYMNNGIALGIAFFFLGLAASGESVGIATISDHFKKDSIAIGYGLNNGLVTLLLALLSPSIALLLDLTKTGIHPNYSEYKTVFNTLILVAFGSFIFATFFIKESFCKSQVDFTYLKIKPQGNSDALT
jgi:MFS family permease